MLQAASAALWIVAMVCGTASFVSYEIPIRISLVASIGYMACHFIELRAKRAGILSELGAITILWVYVDLAARAPHLARE